MSVLDRFKLNGKTALVTGARRGIGKAMALALAEAGADIIGVSVSLEAKGSSLEREVIARGRRFRGYACDFGDRKALYAFLEQVKRGSGKIIFTASLLTFQGGITVPGYAAAKGGIGQLTKALANEWAGAGVQVNAIAPGYIATDNTEALRNDPVRYPAILGRIPAGRWGEPEDFAGAVVFLASPASDYVSGTVLTVDGGWMGR